MPNYKQQAGASGVSLAELVARAKAKRQRPQYDVTVGQPQIRQAPQYDVTIGQPQIQQIPQYGVTVGQPQIQQQPQGGQVNAQANMDPRAARIRAMMSQGATYEQAMRAVQQG